MRKTGCSTETESTVLGRPGTRLLTAVSALVLVACRAKGLAPAGGDAALDGAGDPSDGNGLLDVAATGGIGPGGTVAGGSSGSGTGGAIADAPGDPATGSGGRGGDTGRDGPGDAASSGGRTGTGGGRTSGTGGTQPAGRGGAGGTRTGGAGGGAGGTGIGGAGGGAGGIAASGYCTGDHAKVSYRGQEAAVSATNYRPDVTFDCCTSIGVNLHAQASLGLDLQVEVIMAEDPAPGEHAVDPSSFKLRAAMHTAEEPLPPLYLATGTVKFAGDPNSTQAWEVGVCLQMDDTASPLFGTRIYVPAVAICSSACQRRLQFYLLQDPALNASDAAKLALDSLALATTAQLDLGHIAYVEQSTGRVGLNPGQRIGTALRSALGQVSVYGLPFVVVADDVRIYLGSFASPVSSIRPAGAYVYVDGLSTSVEGITADGFVVQPPWSGSDPRNDPRITQVLTEAGKLVP